MPTKDEIIDIILNSNSEHDWELVIFPGVKLNDNESIYLPKKEVRYYKNDVNLRFENMGIEKENFSEKWTKKIRNEKVSSFRFLLYYASTPIQEFLLVLVDAAQSMLPVAVPPELEVERLKFKVAEIHNDNNIMGFRECINRAGLTVKDD